MPDIFGDHQVPAGFRQDCNRRIAAAQGIQMTAQVVKKDPAVRPSFFAFTSSGGETSVFKSNHYDIPME
jgi:hypothetical protein